MTEKVFFDWYWVGVQLQAIHKQLSEVKYNIRHVSGIPRGGLIPAVLFSHRFGFKFMELEQAKNLTTAARKQVLVFDDIADTGITLSELEGYDFRTATLATRQGSKVIPTFTGELITNDDWLVFPWEERNSETIQGYLAKSRDNSYIKV